MPPPPTFGGLPGPLNGRIETVSPLGACEKHDPIPESPNDSFYHT